MKVFSIHVFTATYLRFETCGDCEPEIVILQRNARSPAKYSPIIKQKYTITCNLAVVKVKSYSIDHIDAKFTQCLSDETHEGELSKLSTKDRTSDSSLIG